MQYPVTQINPHVKFRRNRILPISGTVLVRVGQKVSPSEILAESSVPTRHILIDVFRALALKNMMEAEKVINRQVGELLETHDIIAETGGLFSRVIRTPMPGKVVSIKNGQVLLEVESRKVVVQSGLNGQVVEILQDRGAVVETSGTLIQGVWGNGAIGYGPFVTDPAGIEKELTSAALNITARGAVVAASWCESEESLLMAAELPLGGLILGSMSPRLIPYALKQNFPVILLEGFGRIPINEEAKLALLENMQREISLNAQKRDPYSGTHPEISISLPEESAPEKTSCELQTGQKVRVHTSTQTGQTGVLTALNPGKTSLPNGIKTDSASILFKNNEKAIVPLSNFDIIQVEN